MIDRQTQAVLLNELLDMGELLLDSGAEISRVEDTLTRMGEAYGTQKIEVFVITSIISVTMTFPNCEALTETRRIRSGGATDFAKFEELNALSRQCCAEPLPPGQLQQQLDNIRKQRKPFKNVLLGSVLAAGGFAVFFGGTGWDALAAAAFAVAICLLQDRLGRTQVNAVAFNLTISLLIGLGVGLLTTLIPALHMDKILIGDIMLLIPGLTMTNAIRNMLVGDTISGVVRLTESLIWAAALAGGFMVSRFC